MEKMLKRHEDRYAVPVRKATAKTSGGRKEAQHIGIRVDFDVSIAQDLGEPSDFITVYHGQAIATMKDESERKIGKVTIYMVERGRILNDGISLFEVMDSLDADSCDCFANLFDQETEELNRSFSDCFPKIDPLTGT